MNENKKRIKLWGTICVISLLIAATGIKFYFDGYGAKGQARKKLIPIAEVFNNLDIVKSSSAMKASVSGDTLVIEDTINSKKYKYKYSKTDSRETITNEYDNAYGETIAKNVIEAINKHNGGNQNVFSVITDFNILSRATIAQGISITKGEKTKVEIDINKSILSLALEFTNSSNNANSDPNATDNSESGSSSSIIGTWYQLENGNKTDQYITFNEDNTGSMNTETGILNLTYTITDSTINIHIVEFDLDETSNYRLENGKLIINSEDEVQEYTK